jgi:glycosyltransferase involved in cell wall biosynthesis
MKILMINTLYKPYIGGGAEIVFEDHVNGFKERGYDVVVLTSHPQKGLMKEEVNGVRVYRTDIKNLYWPDPYHKVHPFIRKAWHLLDMYNIAMQSSVKKILKIEKPDLVVLHNIPGFSVAIWKTIKEAKIPMVQILHDLSFLCPGSNMYKNGHPCEKQCTVCHLMRKYHPKYSQNVDAVVGVSKYVLSRFNQYGYFKNAIKTVINNYREIPAVEKASIWTEGKTLRLGYIGVLSEVKGVDILVEQFKILLGNYTLSIAGKGISNEYEQKIKEKAKEDKRIQFLGFVKQSEFFQKIDLLVVPSLWPDTFPTVAIESLAYSVPVIATNMGGLSEIVQDGVNGLIISPTKPDSIILAVKCIQSNAQLYRDFAANARSSIERLLSKKRVFDEYEDLFNKLKK